MSNAENGTNGPVESKVKVAGVASAITSGVMGWILLAVDIPSSLNEPLTGLVLGLVTGALTYGLSWWTKHTNRTDAQAARGKHV
jgi:hypothetical protein